MLGLLNHKLIVDVAVCSNNAFEMISRFLEPAVTAALLSPKVMCVFYLVTELYGKSVVCCSVLICSSPIFYILILLNILFFSL